MEATETAVTIRMASESSPGCTFCDIVAGLAPARVIRSWPDAVAIADWKPRTDGHTLVIPRIHVDNAVQDLDITAMVMRYAAEVARRYRSCNILTNVGQPAKQTVFHLHIHVVPRYPEDHLLVPWGTPNH